jgi:hypothetical protein
MNQAGSRSVRGCPGRFGLEVASEMLCNKPLVSMMAHGDEMLFLITYETV